MGITSLGIEERIKFRSKIQIGEAERRCGQESSYSHSLWMAKRIGTPSPFLAVRNNDPYKEMRPTTSLLRSLPIFPFVARPRSLLFFASENVTYLIPIRCPISMHVV